MAGAGAPERIDRGTVLALGAMALGVFVIANDFTSLSVALPNIEREFDVPVSTVQWVINAYALVFGVLIVTGGRLADLFGRRRIFFVGAAVFAVFSVLGGFAQSAGWLIACRSLMGIGGAMMWPAVLGMTFAILPDSRAGLAGGLILGAAGFGNAMGPLVGGVLTETLSWRWVLFLNLPIALAAIAVVATQVGEQRAQAERERIDYAGIATLSVGLVCILIALDQATDYGWGDWRILALLAVSATLLAAFVAVERGAGGRALVPQDVMRNRQFTAACLTTLLMSAIFFSALLYLPQFMQKLLGYSPLAAGVGLLPMMGLFALTSFAAGPLYERLGPKAVVSAGTVGLFAGILLISLVGREAGYAALVPGMAVLGVGVGLFYSSITTAAVTVLDPARASLAGGIVYMFQIAGGSVGLGLTTTVFTSTSQGRLASDASALGAELSRGELDAVHGILAGTESAQQVVSGLAPQVAERLEGLVRDAFVAGVHAGFRVDAALALLGVVVAVLFVGGRLGRRGAGAVAPPAGR
jgi:EmrB/QacA subfamily drug resistance transporter